MNININNITIITIIVGNIIIVIMIITSVITVNIGLFVIKTMFAIYVVVALTVYS